MDVRLIGVDTPETVKPGAPVDCFGPQASAFNHRLVELEARLSRDLLGNQLGHALDGHLGAGFAGIYQLYKAREAGMRVATVVSAIMHSRRHPEQGFRAALGVLSLKNSYGIERLHAACERAVRMNAISYRSIATILKNGLDRQAANTQIELTLPEQHDNLRGAGYFH